MDTTLKPVAQRRQQAAYELAASRRMACKEDIDLIIEIVGLLRPAPVVVQLGAGSGTMALAVLGTRPKARFWSVDNNPNNLGWEALALENTGYRIIRRHWILSDSAKAGSLYDGPSINLLIVDADHRYLAVRADLKAWLPWIRPRGLILIHDYDGTTAPRQYKGPKRAADQIFGVPPWKKAGWSAVFKKEDCKWQVR